MVFIDHISLPVRQQKQALIDSRSSALRPYLLSLKYLDGLQDVSGLLVANGLARVHGTKAKPPDADITATELQATYEQLETEAKSEGAGAWGSGEEIKLAPYTNQEAKEYHSQ